MKYLIASVAALASFAVANPVIETELIEKRADANVSTACADIHYIVARASTEPQGFGISGTVSNASASKYPGSTAESIVYPALLLPYEPSSTAGTAATKKQLTAYVDKCPSSRIVMIGYSQVSQLPCQFFWLHKVIIFTGHLLTTTIGCSYHRRYSLRRRKYWRSLRASTSTHIR
jgi:Cutinase